MSSTLGGLAPSRSARQSERGAPALPPVSHPAAVVGTRAILPRNLASCSCSSVVSLAFAGIGMRVPTAAVTSCDSRVSSMAARSDVARECARGDTPRQGSVGVHAYRACTTRSASTRMVVVWSGPARVIWYSHDSGWYEP